MPDPIPTPTPMPAPEPTPSPTPTPAPTPDPAPAPLVGEKPAVVEPPAPEPAPEPLTFEALKIPADFAVTDDQKTSFLATMNDSKLSPAARAQALLDMQYAAAKSASETMGKKWNDQQAAWQTETKADPIVGGDKLEPALAVIDKAIESYGTAEDQIKLRSIFATSGVGNQAHMIRFIHHLGTLAKFSEGSPLPAPGTPASESDAAKRLYSNSNMK